MERTRLARSVSAGPLQAPLAQGPPGVTLEVEEDDVAAGVEDVPQVQVAVDADALAVPAQVAQRARRASTPGEGRQRPRPRRPLARVGRATAAGPRAPRGPR